MTAGLEGRRRSGEKVEAVGGRTAAGDRLKQAGLSAGEAGDRTGRDGTAGGGEPTSGSRKPGLVMVVNHGV